MTVRPDLASQLVISDAARHDVTGRRRRRISSLPPSPTIRSAPPSPSIVSLFRPPRIWSRLGPPAMRSPPLPPRMRSRPPLPRMRSSPPLPQMTSPLLVPTRRSPAAVPSISHAGAAATGVANGRDRAPLMTAPATRSIASSDVARTWAVLLPRRSVRTGSGHAPRPNARRDGAARARARSSSLRRRPRRRSRPSPRRS